MTEFFHKKVEFPGHGVFWFLCNSDGSGGLAPLDHCDEKGNILPFSMNEIPTSYAHVFQNGMIMRFNKPIGSIHDLKEIL
jgi:hypothetical protein